MGSGIAQVAAAAGAEVILHDRDEGFVQRGLDAIARNLDRGVERGRLTPEQRGHIIARITPTAHIADWDVAIAIEAATEALEIKQAAPGLRALSAAST